MSFYVTYIRVGTRDRQESRLESLESLSLSLDLVEGLAKVSVLVSISWKGWKSLVCLWLAHTSFQQNRSKIGREIVIVCNRSIPWPPFQKDNLYGILLYFEVILNSDAVIAKLLRLKKSTSKVELYF